MSPNGRKNLQRMLMRQEGYKPSLYKDTRGHTTGGFGHNFDAKNLSEATWLVVLEEDTQDAIRDLVVHLPWYTNLNEARQSALVSMCFNLGISGLLEFQRTLEALKSEHWQEAHDYCLQSLAAQEDKARYAEIAQILLSGEIAA